VQPVSVPARDWRRAIIGTVLFTIAIIELTLLVMAQPRLDTILGLLAVVAGLAVFCVGGADRHHRRARRRAKDAELSPPPRHRSSGPPPDGFTDKIDKLVNHYFHRYVPRGTAREQWLAQTAGIRWQLRTEIADLYREQRIGADRVAWLIRYLVGDVRKRWEQGTLTAYRDQLRVPARTVILYLGGLVILTVGAVMTIPAAVSAAPLPGVAWSLLAVASAVPAVRAMFRIIAEHRRVADDQAELAEQDRARWEAYHRWLDKLSDKPSDTEMAAWLEGDRKVLVDEAMRQCRLRPSQVIAHAFIEAPKRPCKKARYPHGPWRYSRYCLLLFLLTDDGVRQVNIDLDFETATSRTTQRLNYRFDAVASVRIDGIATQQQTFELTLISGDPISIRVGEPNHDTRQDDEDPTKIAELSLDAAGLSQTLHILEGIAAEGKEWVRHRRRRADDRLATLANTLRGLFD
jgi:hypothetical protein